MKTVATIECRTGSTRLPGKVLLEACAKTMIEHMIERVRRAQGLDAVVLATTTNPRDDVLESVARRAGIEVFRGSEDDVLGRVVQAARANEADRVVQLCGDCPLLDPDIISRAIELFPSDRFVGITNIGTGYPDGMDVQVFLFDALEESSRKGQMSEDREHVGWYIRQHPEEFPLALLEPDSSLRRPQYRLVLDEEIDYQLLKLIFEHFLPEHPKFDCRDIIDYLDRNSATAALNAHLHRY